MAFGTKDPPGQRLAQPEAGFRRIDKLSASRAQPVYGLLGSEAEISPTYHGLADPQVVFQALLKAFD